MGALSGVVRARGGGGAVGAARGSGWQARGLAQQRLEPRNPAQLVDARTQRRARGRGCEFGPEQPCVQHPAPALTAQGEKCEAPPGLQTLTLRAEDSDARQQLRTLPQRAGYGRRERAQAGADDVGETRVDALAQLVRLLLQHVAQPVTT